jgi:hypothetical protein
MKSRIWIFKFWLQPQTIYKQFLTLQKECYQTEAELHNEFNIPPLTQTIDSIFEDFKNGTLFLKGIINGQIIASVRGNIKNNTTYIGRL